MFLRYRPPLLALLLAPLLVLPGITMAGAQSAGTAASGSLNKAPTVSDVAATPLRDVNLKKTAIPPVLERAATDPYTLKGLDTCAAIIAQVRQLNGALGQDIDDAHAQGHEFQAGHLMQSVVDSVIPFGGIIKEVSGANAQQRRLQAAIAAGFARRGFLKGVGMSRKCPAPAHPS